MAPANAGSLRHAAERGGRTVLVGVVTNAVLAAVKVIGGFWGHSNALLADGLESALDILSSTLLWGALQYAGKPPDEEHPYGHGKVESLAAVVGAIFLLAAGASVAAHSAWEIWTLRHYESAAANQMPKAWTLAILVLVIITKEFLFRMVRRKGEELGSTAMKVDAWHHRSDAITSLAAFAGISIALIGRRGWESADDWAALLSCAIIVRNGAKMLRTAMSEVMDAQMSEDLVERLAELACQVDGVASAEKFRIRKSGLTQIADLHVRVDGSLTVREGHEISHCVKDRLLSDPELKLSDVTVHIEPQP